MIMFWGFVHITFYIIIYICCVYIFNVIQVLPGSPCIFMFFTQINLRNILYLLKRLNFAECDNNLNIYFHNVSYFAIYIVHFQKGTQNTGWTRNKVYLHFVRYMS